jgi:hypothetical protein
MGVSREVRLRVGGASPQGGASIGFSFEPDDGGVRRNQLPGLKLGVHRLNCHGAARCCCPLARYPGASALPRTHHAAGSERAGNQRRRRRGSGRERGAVSRARVHRLPAGAATESRAHSRSGRDARPRPGLSRGARRTHGRRAAAASAPAAPGVGGGVSSLANGHGLAGSARRGARRGVWRR